MLGGWPLGHPHQRHHHGAREGRQAQRHPGGQGESDTEQAEHEQPVRPAGSGPGVERGLHRSDGDRTEESLGGRAAVDPALAGLGGVAEAEGLVEEGPQEDEAHQHPGRGEHVGPDGVRVRVCRRGGLGGGGGPVPVQGRQVEPGLRVRVLVDGHGGDSLVTPVTFRSFLTPLTLPGRAGPRRVPMVLATG